MKNSEPTAIQIEKFNNLRWMRTNLTCLSTATRYSMVGSDMLITTPNRPDVYIDTDGNVAAYELV
jgi:hypothetical protein